VEIVVQDKTKQPAETAPVKTATEARGAHIVKGGAMRRIVIVSAALAAVAMLIAFFVVR